MSIVTIHGPTMYYDSTNEGLQNMFATPFIGHYFAPAFTEVDSVAKSGYRKLPLAPIFVPKTLTVDRLTCFPAQTDDTSDVHIAIYNSDDDLMPKDLLFSDAVTAVTNAVLEATCSLSLSPGWYWLGAVSFDDPLFTFECVPDTYYGVFNAPFPSLGANVSDVKSVICQTGGGISGVTVIHATTLGGDTPATITSLPSTITPGVTLIADDALTPVMVMRRSA